MLRKGLWITLGWISLMVGAIGAILPILPAFPFLLLAAFSFGKSSQRLHDWFINTKLYKKNLESFVSGKGMTLKVKIRVITVVTLTMAFGFIMMKNLVFPRILLSIVWVGHVLYFVFRVNTIRDKEPPLSSEYGNK
ncbi:YbaN family protein [Fusibacter bizertensis]